jgi:hypothetical protein
VSLLPRWAKREGGTTISGRQSGCTVDKKGERMAERLAERLTGRLMVGRLTGRWVGAVVGETRDVAGRTRTRHEEQGHTKRLARRSRRREVERWEGLLELAVDRGVVWVHDCRREGS